MSSFLVVVRPLRLHSLYGYHIMALRMLVDRVRLQSDGHFSGTGGRRAVPDIRRTTSKTPTTVFGVDARKEFLTWGDLFTTLHSND